MQYTNSLLLLGHSVMSFWQTDCDSNW